MGEETIELIREVIREYPTPEENYIFVLEYNKEKDEYRPKIVMGDGSVYSEGLWEKRGSSISPFDLKEGVFALKDKLDIIEDKGKLNVKIEKIIREFCMNYLDKNIQKNSDKDYKIYDKKGGKNIGIIELIRKPTTVTFGINKDNKDNKDNKESQENRNRDYKDYKKSQENHNRNYRDYKESQEKGPFVTPNVTSVTTEGVKKGKNKVVSHVTSVTSVTSVTNEKERFIKKPNNSENSIPSVTKVTNVTNVTLDEMLQSYFFGDNLLHVLLILSQKQGLNYENLSNETGISQTTLRQIISNRYKEYFIQAGKKDKKILWTLSQKGKQYFLDELEYSKRIQEKKKTDCEEIIKEIESKEDLKFKIKSMIENVNYEREGDFLIFKCIEIGKFEPELVERLLTNPKEFYEITNEVLKIYKKQFQVTELPHTNKVHIQDLRAESLGKLLNVQARITSFGDVIGIIKSIDYACPRCNSLITINQEEFKKIKEPSKCSCGRKGGFKELSKKVGNISRLILEDIQEKTDNAFTKRIEGYILDPLTNMENIKIFNSGNEIDCIGLLEEVRNETTLTKYRFNILSAKTLEEEVQIDSFKPEEMKEIKEVCKKIDEEGLKVLLNSFSPETYGYDHIKKAIMLQIACARNDPTTKVRSKPNILLIGDPGVAKSVMCRYGIEITPCSKRAVGGGSSAVGITASVIKEENSLGGYRVEPGAIVQAKDIFFLDELNNLNDEEKPKLQEGMNEMSITISKASIHTKLKVVSGMLATANPIEGIFNPNTNIFKQFNIPAAIINRFDLIFILKDFVDEYKDTNIADIMIKRDLHKIEPLYNKKFMKKLFYFIRHQEEPEINEDTINFIKEVYVNFRKLKNKDVNINPRFLEAILRLCKAHAKCRLSKTIEKKDIIECIKIINESHYSEGGAIINYTESIQEEIHTHRKG